MRYRVTDVKTPKEPLPTEVYTVEEIQQLLGIGRKTVYELMKDPPFPVRKVLNQYRIPKVEFGDWLHYKATDFKEDVTNVD